jgi:hypothetical protein
LGTKKWFQKTGIYQAKEWRSKMISCKDWPCWCPRTNQWSCNRQNVSMAHVCSLQRPRQVRHVIW